ncbi:MAG: AI-2E family transporter [Clostridium sp.]|nr:AI-2E family transporter [Clostridium sp.]
MFFDRNIKYRDILIFALIGIIGYKLIDNYKIFFDFFSDSLSIIAPFIYALVFAYILNPIMKIFEKKLKLSRGISVLCTYLIILGLLTVCMVFLIPTLVDSIGSMIDEIPSYVTKVQGWITKAYNNQRIKEAINDIGLASYLSSIPSNVGSIVSGMLEGSLTSIFNIATNLVKIVFGILISIYVLIFKETFIEKGKIVICMIFKEKWALRIINLAREYHKNIGRYVGAKAVDSLIIGLLAFIGLMVIKAPYPYLIAIIVGVTNMIPYFGPLVGEIVGVFFGIFVSWKIALITFIYLLALQQFDAWYLEAKVVGKKLSLNPVSIIFGIIVLGGFFGVIGMLLASPTMATITDIYKKKEKKFLNKNEGILERIDNIKDKEKKNKDTLKEDEKEDK